MNNKIIKWINKNIKADFHGKNVFITGGNSGIGFALAEECAYLGANIFLLCRSLNKAEKAQEEIMKLFPQAKITLIQLDLASLKSIQNCVNELAKYKIDYFINNAGVCNLPKSKTENGFEITMGTNYLGSLYLNDLLLEKGLLSNGSHVVFETSMTSRFERINFDDFFMDKKYKPLTIYARSKCAINCMWKCCVETYKNSGVSFSLCHPGVVYTPLINKGFKNKIIQVLAKPFMMVFFHNPYKGALSILMSMNDKNNACYGPKGLLEMSGYPHVVHFKIDKDYTRCVELGRTYINSALERQ